MNGKHTMRVALALGAVLAIGAAVGAQQPAPKKPGGAIGDLTAIDAAKGALTITTTAGATTTAKVTAATEYLLIEPGETSLEGAEKIALADVKLGDRVWARGEPGADGAIQARQLVVMSAQAIAERHTRDAREWQTRGLIGEVRAVNPESREIMVETYRGDSVVVATSDATTLRRLRPRADLSHAQSIGFESIEVSNQIAVRGDRSADGARMTAETIVAGTFPRPVRGRVTAVDAAARAVTIVGRENRPVQLTLGENALVRKINPPPAGQPPAGGAPAAAGGGPGPRGFAFALGDPAELERRTTAVELADVKPGDFVFAVVEPGATADAARVKVLVKAEIPADRPQRGAPSMQMPDMGFGDVP